MDVTHSESAFAFKRSSVRGALEGLEVSLHEVAVGSFCGRVRFVVRHGSDTLSQEAVMSVSKPLVGFSYRYRSPGSTSDPQESDVACGDLGESASQRGVSLSVILPAEGRHGALDEGAIGARAWLVRRPDGRFDVGVHSRRSLGPLGLGEHGSEIPGGRSDGRRSIATDEEPILKANGLYLLRVAYRLDR